MKNKTLLLLLLCAVPVTALLEGGHRITDGDAVTGTAFLVSPVDTSLSGLDVRDARGRSIQDASAKEGLEALFRENLVILTVFASPHYTAVTHSWLNLFSYLFNKTIFTRLLIIFNLFQDVYLPTTRRFVHNVHNLWTTIAIILFLSCSLYACRFSTVSTRPLNLRC